MIQACMAHPHHIWTWSGAGQAKDPDLLITKLCTGLWQNPNGVPDWHLRCWLTLFLDVDGQLAWGILEMKIPKVSQWLLAATFIMFIINRIFCPFFCWSGWFSWGGGGGEPITLCRLAFFGRGFWCYTLIFFMSLPTHSWCYALHLLFPVTSKMLLMPRSSLVFSCNFQDSLHATRLTFLHVTSNTLLMLCSSLVISCNFQDALHAALLNLNLSHVASNTLLMLRPQPFLCNFPHALDARLLTFFKEKKVPKLSAHPSWKKT